MAFNLRSPPNLTPKLEAFPYQLEALRAICDRPYAAVFHEQGLGKTKIAIDLVLHWLSEDVVDTVFIMTKKALVKNWCDEFDGHSHIKPRVLSDNKKSNGAALNAPVIVYVLNYEVCLSNVDLMSLFLKTCRVGAILDESQKIKNPEAQLTQAFLDLSDGFTRKIIMTGTPVANRPQDIWSQVKFLDGGKSLGDDFEAFKSRVDLPDGVASGEYEAKLSDLHSHLREFSVRETKETAAIELPTKKIVSCPIKLAPRQREIYETYKSELSYQFETMTGTVNDDVENVLKRLLRLVQCASNPAIINPAYDETPAKFMKLNTLLEDEIPSNEKVIVWTSFIDNANWLAVQLAQYQPAKVHGEIRIDTRNVELDRFKQQTDCRVLIATPGAAKEGLTLTAANHAVFFDRSFSLDDYLQAQDRIHRISQKRECFIYNFIAQDSIDEWVDQLLYAKFKAAQLVQGDVKHQPTERVFTVDLSEMLEEVLRPQTQE